MAYKSNMSYIGKKIDFILKDEFGNVIPSDKLYKSRYTSIICSTCGNKIVCNGCSNCGKCI